MIEFLYDPFYLRNKLKKANERIKFLEIQLKASIQRSDFIRDELILLTKKYEEEQNSQKESPR